MMNWRLKFRNTNFLITVANQHLPATSQIRGLYFSDTLDYFFILFLEHQPSSCLDHNLILLKAGLILGQFYVVKEM